MAILSSKDLLEEFYKEEGHKFDITLEECNLICSSPFKLTKEILSRGLLKNIRLQYLGVFEVMAGRVQYSLKSLEKNYSESKISEKRYKERKEVLSNYEES